MQNDRDKYARSANSGSKHYLCSLHKSSSIQTILSAPESHRFMPFGSRALPPVGTFTLPRRLRVKLQSLYLCFPFMQEKSSGIPGTKRSEKRARTAARRKPADRSPFMGIFRSCLSQHASFEYGSIICVFLHNFNTKVVRLPDFYLLYSHKTVNSFQID